MNKEKMSVYGPVV